MPEVGLVQLARTALKVAQAVLPKHRTRFSKKQFTEPQLLALHCVMRFEDWTYREAEMRLAEHQELRRALGLQSVPDHTTVYRFLRRLKEEDLTKVLAEVVKHFPRYKGRHSIVAVDATGLASGAISTFFIHRLSTTRSAAHVPAVLAQMAGGGGCQPSSAPGTSGACRSGQ